MNRQLVSKFAIGLAVFGLVWGTMPANAQTVIPFQTVGHIQSFCLTSQVLTPTSPCPTPAEKVSLAAAPTSDSRLVANTPVLSGALIVVNGITVTIPSNSVIKFPAAYITPQQAFAYAQGVSSKYQESGLALQDKFPPLAAFEVAIDGNIVNGVYIAGLVSISQQSLNTSAGYIRSIDTALDTAIHQGAGMMCVGGSPTPSPLPPACSPGDSIIRLNDPKLLPSDDFPGDGRYGSPNPNPPSIQKPNPASPPVPAMIDDPNSRFPDPRFTVDQGNPTVHATTGYPMCVPRSATDLECPASNRANASGLTTYVMTGSDLINPTPGLTRIPACSPSCDPTKQVPLMVGDYITFQGTLANYYPNPSDKTNSVSYVSVHTLEANLGIYTAPGTDPAYVSIDPIKIGTNGNIGTNPVRPGSGICGTAAECQDLLVVEGFTTDPFAGCPRSRTPPPPSVPSCPTGRQLNVYALDITPAGGATVGPPFVSTLRPILQGTTRPAPLGRFRFSTKSNPFVLKDNATPSVLRGATRELVVRIEPGLSTPIGGSKPLADLLPHSAHGLQAGHYQAPIGEYIYPEPLVMGDPLPAMLNFQCLSFLARGWTFTDLTGETVNPSRLTPWPGFADASGDTRFFSCTE